jgi:hypothetical protein
MTAFTFILAEGKCDPPHRSCVLNLVGMKIYEFDNPKATKIGYSALNIITKAIYGI